MSKFLILLGLFFTSIAPAWSVPRMALTAGTPCSACHVNLQGAGIRTEIGWGASLYNGAFLMEDMGLEDLEPESNQIGFGISAGVDIRFLLARLGRPTADTSSGEVEAILPDRALIPMQIQVNLAAELTEWMTLYGGYNIDRGTFDGEICEPHFPGQSCFEAAAILKPGSSWPSLRVGQIQPSIGVRHDDHTILIRGDALRPSQPLIPPNYADLGAELHYQPVHWLLVNAGGFSARNLSEALADPSIVAESDAAFLGRVAVYPRFDALSSLISWIGASLFMAGDFQMLNSFLGVGWLDWASLFVESANSWRGDDTTSLNVMVGLEVTPKEWFVLHGRVERATTETETETQTDAFVAGVKFFPFPFITLNPEYRILQTQDYTMGQYTMQLHLFY